MSIEIKAQGKRNKENLAILTIYIDLNSFSSKNLGVAPLIFTGGFLFAVMLPLLLVLVDVVPDFIYS